MKKGSINLCRFPCFHLPVSARGLSIKIDSGNPVVVGTRKNITMQWSINETAASNIKFINVYFQSQSIKKTQIVYYTNSKVSVDNEGKKIYGNRLRPDFADSKFTLVIFNAKYSDTGSYSVEFVLETWERGNEDATVNVYGMFFSYCQ